MMKQHLIPVVRILDVNFNRAREALRVIEDYTRFVLDSQPLTRHLRQLRNNLVRILKGLHIRSSLIAARDVMGDIGRGGYAGISKTSSITEVVLVNFKRLEESLRVLAEYLKISYPKAVAKLEKLRFSAYQLEESLTQILHPQKALGQSRLYVLISSDLTKTPSIRVTQAVIKGGADAIQLREKTLSDAKLLNLAWKIRGITLKHRVLFIINDRVDWAIVSRADGVHLGREDMPIRQARRILGPDKIIGATTHNIKEALDAQRNGADYISVGPMFPSPTKQALPAQGFKYLDKVAQEITIPYFAIGGINERNLPQLLKRHKAFRTGPLKIAISSGIISKTDPTTATRRVKKILTKSLTVDG